MTRKEFKEIENYMLGRMLDSAHDRHHIYRVLYCALDIAAFEHPVDYDVLLAACLLHDIGREKQSTDIKLDHAQIGGEMAYEFLKSQNWSEDKALRVKECISTHRFRGDRPPQSIEAKILFDSDKLDASGALGISRTLIFEGQISEPLYILDPKGSIIVDGGWAESSSFFQEYNFKLKNIYAAFHTKRAGEIAIERQKTAVGFYNGLYSEITQTYKSGLERMQALFPEE